MATERFLLIVAKLDAVYAKVRSVESHTVFDDINVAKGAAAASMLMSPPRRFWVIYKVTKDGAEGVASGGIVRPSSVWDVIEEALLLMIESLIVALKEEIRKADGAYAADGQWIEHECKPQAGECDRQTECINLSPPTDETFEERCQRVRVGVTKLIEDEQRIRPAGAMFNPWATGEPTAHTLEWVRSGDVSTSLVAPLTTASQTEMDFPDAWAKTKGKSAVVGVLDTGCRTSHTAFGGARIEVIDCVGQGQHIADVNSHGTFVTSQIAARTLGVGNTGDAPEVSVCVAAVLAQPQGYGTDSWIARGIMALLAVGVDVITGSLGGPDPLPETEKAIRAALKAGVPVCFATGNGGQDLDQVAYPARYDGVIGVGSCTSHGVQSPFSQDGYGLDIYACGERQLGAVSSGGYQLWDGTSMATPHVAAAIALRMSDRKSNGRGEETPMATEFALYQSAKGRDIGESGQAGWAGTLQAGALVSAGMPADPPPAPPTPTDEVVYEWTQKGISADEAMDLLVPIAAEYYKGVAGTKFKVIVTRPKV